MPATPELVREHLALTQVQRWMQAVITHPDGVAEGMAGDGARAALGLADGRSEGVVESERVVSMVGSDGVGESDGAVGSKGVVGSEGVSGSEGVVGSEGVMRSGAVVRSEAVVRGSARLSAGERLWLYSRDYHSRLLDCLRASHPALRELLGEELFDAFALDYLRAHPPRARTLQRLGAGFADHLDSTRPADAEWGRLIVEVARIERALAEVYDGPGVEGERILRPDALPRGPRPSWSRVRLQPAPCLRLMRSRFPVGPYLRAVRRGERPALPRAGQGQESFLALCRVNWIVTITDLSAPEYAALRELASGRALGELDEPRVWGWLGGWAAAGFWRGVRPSTRACTPGGPSWKFHPATLTQFPGSTPGAHPTSAGTEEDDQ